jgi:hypothetical protein
MTGRSTEKHPVMREALAAVMIPPRKHWEDRE